MIVSLRLVALLELKKISRAQGVEEAHTTFCSEYYYMHEKTITEITILCYGL
jgi:hypothetical protein